MTLLGNGAVLFEPRAERLHILQEVSDRLGFEWLAGPRLRSLKVETVFAGARGLPNLDLPHEWKDPRLPSLRDISNATL
jgi:hypothetical protein